MRAETSSEPDVTADFFRSVPARSREVLSHRHNGTILIKISEDRRVEPWLITVENGQATVSRADDEADCVITLDKPLFNSIVVGEAQFGPYLFRGRLLLKGDFRAFGMLRRMLPDMKGARDPRSLPAVRRGRT